MSKAKGNRGDEGKSGYEKFATPTVAEEEPTPVVKEPPETTGSQETAPTSPAIDKPVRDARSPAIQAAAAYATGRAIPGLTVKEDAHPLLLACYELIQKLLAGHIIAPFAMLAQMECEKMLDALRKEIEYIEK